MAKKTAVTKGKQEVPAKTAAGATVVAAQHNEDGKIVRLLIRCTHPGCEKTREIKVQDARQTVYCKEHADPKFRRQARSWVTPAGGTYSLVPADNTEGESI